MRIHPLFFCASLLSCSPSKDSEKQPSFFYSPSPLYVNLSSGRLIDHLFLFVSLFFALPIQLALCESISRFLFRRPGCDLFGTLQLQVRPVRVSLGASCLSPPSSRLSPRIQEADRKKESHPERKRRVGDGALAGSKHTSSKTTFAAFSRFAARSFPFQISFPLIRFLSASFHRAIGNDGLSFPIVNLEGIETRSCWFLGKRSQRF